MPFYYGYGYYGYIIYMLPALLLTIYAQIKVKTTFSKYQKIAAGRGLTAADVAQRILSAYGLSQVRIEHIAGSLTDHYDPRTNVVRLSDAVYGSSSISAIGVAAHEVGHAIQHASCKFFIICRAFKKIHEDEKLVLTFGVFFYILIKLKFAVVFW